MPPIRVYILYQEWAAREGKIGKPTGKPGHPKMVQFLIGKDNIVFHCIISQVMLKAHGDLYYRKMSLQRFLKFGKGNNCPLQELGGMATCIWKDLSAHARMC